MDKRLAYNKDEVLAAIKAELTIGEERRERLIELVEKAECESFIYGSGDINEMRIIPAQDRREGSPRRNVCGHALEKILRSLGAEGKDLGFSSSVSIESEQEHAHFKKL